MTDHESCEVVLFADGLCSKWGFCDGDLLLEDHTDQLAEAFGDDFRSNFDWQEALCDLVEKFLLPILPVPVEVHRISGCHNPIRASKIKGEEWDSYTIDVHPDLEGVSVSIPWEQALEVIRASYISKEPPHAL